MKKSVLFIATAVALLCSCNKNNDITPGIEAGSQTVIVNVVDGAMTKADAFTEQQNYEKQINSVQVLVFDAEGNLNAYKNAGTTVTGIAITSTTGAKKIWAVVNGPDASGISNLNELKAIEVGLDDNSVLASEGFIMVGSVDYNVSNTNTEPASIVVSRLLSRVALRSVANKAPVAYGNLNIVSVFLQNVVGNHTIGNGSAPEALWCNKMARNDAGIIIDGTTAVASCPTLTFNDINETVALNAKYEPGVPELLYCYQNDVTTYATSTTWSARKTAMTIAAKFDGVDDVVRYYTIVLPDAASGTIKPNTAYTVDVVITGLGSVEPNQPIEKNDFTSTITVANWSEGTVLSEEL